MAEVATGERARYGEVFAIREFRALFSSQLVSVIGDVVASVAVMVLIFDRTGSTVLAALTMTAMFVPYLAAGLVVPRQVGRWPPRRVLVVCDLVRAGLVAVMLIPGLPIAALLGALAATGLVSPMFTGVRAALTPVVLGPGPQYIVGRSVIRTMSQVAQVVGYGAGGALVGLLSARGALAVDVASFLVSAVLISSGLTRRPAGQAAEAVPPTGMLRVLGEPEVRRLLLLGWLLPACLVAPEALGTPYVHRLGEPASALGLYLCAIPAGTIVAALVVPRVLGPVTQRRLVVPATLVGAAALLAFAARPTLWPALAVLVVLGLSTASMPGLDRLLLDRATLERRSATLAASNAGLMGLQGLGFAMWGAVAEVLPIRVVVPIAGIVTVLVVVAWRPRHPHDRSPTRR